MLGVRIDAVQIPGVIARMEQWIAQRGLSRYIAVTGMHGVVEADADPQFAAILECAALTVPDGMPLIWLGRRRGFDLRRRVYGPELLSEFCRATVRKGYRHFFYGGVQGVPGQLAERLQAAYPGMQVAGTYSPPFCALSSREDDEMIAMINASAPDLVWVGLSTPKQERWMYEHRNKIHAPVLVGVGAAFDFHTGRVAQAPEWMRENGFEWLFRLLQEPRRLWRRYLLGGSKFALLVTLEALRVRRSSQS